MGNRSYAHIGVASIILGGAGLLFIAGGFELLQNNGAGGWLAIVGGLALWALLVFFYWVNRRAYRQQEWTEQQAYPLHAEHGLKRGGFWKGALIAWLAVLVVHAAAFVAAFSEALPEEVRGQAFLAAIAYLPAAHVVVPLLGGLVWRMVQSTATPKR